MTPHERQAAPPAPAGGTARKQQVHRPAELTWRLSECASGTAGGFRRTKRAPHLLQGGVVGHLQRRRWGALQAGGVPLVCDCVSVHALGSCVPATMPIQKSAVASAGATNWWRCSMVLCWAFHTAPDPQAAVHSRPGMCTAAMSWEELGSSSIYEPCDGDILPDLPMAAAADVSSQQPYISRLITSDQQPHIM